MLGRYSAAALSGLMLALAFPLTLLPLPFELAALFPYNVAADRALGPLGSLGLDTTLGYVQFPWLAFVALVPLLLAVRGCDAPPQAFRLGYVTGLLWLSLSFLWISNFGALPVVGLVLFFSLPVGLFSWIAWWLLFGESRLGAAVRIVWLLPVAWVAIEYLRSFGFWSFPWNLLGYSQAGTPLLLQTADLGGVYAVSFLIVLVNAALFALLALPAPLGARLLQSALAAVVFAAALGYGLWRIETIGPPLLQVQPDGGLNASLHFALVQGGKGSMENYEKQQFPEYVEAYTGPTRRAVGNWVTLATGVPQPPEPPAVKPGAAVPWRGGLRPAADPPDRTPDTGAWPGADAVSLTPGAGAAEATQREGPGNLLVIWPESCLPRTGIDPRNPTRLPQEVKQLTSGRPHLGLLFGALGWPKHDDHLENGAVLQESGERLAWAYSKVRLVPFGEVLPFRGLVKFLDYPWGSEDLREGRSVRPVKWKDRSFGVMICFDNVFSFLTRRQVRQGAQYLVLMTNNSWYPMRSGVRQHCDLDIMRAVEVRRPLLRVSTTGWSQVVDSAGRILRTSQAGGPALIETQLRPGRGRSPYLVVGDLLAQLCLAIALLFCVPLVLRGRSEGFL